MKALLLIAVIVSVAAGNEKRYPQEALQCLASAVQSQQDGMIICPQGSNFCVKEVINATRADCGAVKGTTHFGRDVWDVKLAQCVYRKCAHTHVHLWQRDFLLDMATAKIKAYLAELLAVAKRICVTEPTKHLASFR